MIRLTPDATNGHGHYKDSTPEGGCEFGHYAPELTCMIITDKIALRLLEKREWLTPEEGLKKAEVHGFLTEALSSIKELKKRLSNRSDIEEHQAALFVGGLKSRAPCFTWEYSPGELGEINREADCFCRVNIDGQYYYKPLPLTEVAYSSIARQC